MRHNYNFSSTFNHRQNQIFLFVLLRKNNADDLYFKGIAACTFTALWFKPVQLHCTAALKLRHYLQTRAPQTSLREQLAGQGKNLPRALIRLALGVCGGGRLRCRTRGNNRAPIRAAVMRSSSTEPFSTLDFITCSQQKSYAACKYHTHSQTTSMHQHS